MWSEQQETAYRAARAWLADKDGPRVFYLAGYAGTGKSTLARRFGEDSLRVRYAAFTGKAAMVMKAKGCGGATTIHSLIYRPVELPGGRVRFELNEMSPAVSADLVVLDECSMVGEFLAEDLLKLAKRVLVIGDPFQLPPVEGGGYFTTGPPDAMLTEIHRQAADSPIISLATAIRTGCDVSFGSSAGCRVIRRRDVTDADMLGHDQIIVGMNRTREGINDRVRELLGRPYRVPAAGDRLICLRNTTGYELVNGESFTVESVEPRLMRYGLVVRSEDRESEHSVSVRKEFFEYRDRELTHRELKETHHLTFGYAVTCHKAQGSQWPRVLVIDEGFVFRDDARRWLYTAVTRSADVLTLAR